MAGEGDEIVWGHTAASIGLFLVKGKETRTFVAEAPGWDSYTWVLFLTLPQTSCV